MMISATIYNITWISTNPIFSERNSIPLLTEHIKMNDRIRFSCSTNATEQTAIHRVNEYAAINCHGPAKFMDSLIGTCTKANDSIIISLREIPMLPNGMSYKPNNDYFFITTSTGDKNGLENGKGGLCRTKNMRLKIRIEAKRTEVSQRIPEFTAKNGHVMMIPVNSGQYAVPIVYVPVAQSSESNEGNQKQPVFPYHLYFANGQFRATNSNLEDLGSSSELRFDANDQPKNFAFATNSNGYIAPKALREKDNDFEIEYMDPNSAIKRSYERSGIVVITIITNYIMNSRYCFTIDYF
ncbi:Ephrin-4 [Dirofilaria immitis]